MSDSVVGSGHVDKALLIDQTGQAVWGKGSEVEVYTGRTRKSHSHADLSSKLDEPTRNEQFGFRL